MKKILSYYLPLLVIAALFVGFQVKAADEDPKSELGYLVDLVADDVGGLYTNNFNNLGKEDKDDLEEFAEEIAVSSDESYISEDESVSSLEGSDIAPSVSVGIAIKAVSKAASGEGEKKPTGDLSKSSGAGAGAGAGVGAPTSVRKVGGSVASNKIPCFKKDPDGKWHCPKIKCIRDFPSKDGLKNHYIGYHAGGFKCQICNSNLRSILGLASHITKNHSELHAKRKRSQSSTGRHRKEWYCSTGFKCDKCPKSFTRKTRLEEHIKADHEGHRFECRECSKTFKRIDGLSRHIRAEHHGRKYICPVCNGEFVQTNELWPHIRTEHPGDVSRLKKLGKSFSNINDLSIKKGHRVS